MRDKMDRPYGLGFNGHARKCDCARCAASRAKEVKRYLTAPTVKIPEARDATVLVRAHFRRMPDHMKRYPRSKRALRRLLAQWGER